MKYVIGIDCGTTNVKAVAYDEKGNELAKSSVSNIVINNGILNEQDMYALWDNVLLALRNLVSENEWLKEGTVGICCSGQGEGLWALDGNNRPVRNAILWNDGRSYEIIDSLKKDNEKYVAIKKILASYIKNGSSITLIKWFKENEKENWEKTKTIFTCKDWIRYCLTGNIAWEYTDASCSCMDLTTKKYAIGVFESLGIADAVSKLPSVILHSIDNAGGLLPSVAEITGLEPGIPVAGGMIDICSSAAGIGLTEVNDTCIILGTTGMTLSQKDEYVPDAAFNGWEYSADGMSFVKGMGTMAATPNLDWARKTLFPNLTGSEFYALIENEIGKRLPGSNGLIYHPHISASGERAPFFESRATASFLGIREDTTPLDMLQAVMEGVVLSIKDCLIDAECHHVNVTGGGSNNKVWMQMLSDALGCTVAIQEATELSAKGAALSAAIASGMLEDCSDKSFFPIRCKYTPDMERNKLFDEMYRIYKSTQGDMNAFWTWRFDYLKSIKEK